MCPPPGDRLAEHGRAGVDRPDRLDESLGGGIEVPALPKAGLELFFRGLGMTCGVVPVGPPMTVAGDGQIPARPGSPRLLPTDDFAHSPAVGISQHLTLGPRLLCLEDRTSGTCRCVSASGPGHGERPRPERCGRFWDGGRRAGHWHLTGLWCESAG